MARLRIHFAGTDTVISLKGTETTVGRSNRCTIHLPDKTLADIHFRIQEKSRGYRLKDDGSGLGTKVNGKEVYATTLQHGDEISAGGLRCVFLTEKDVPVAPPAPQRDDVHDFEDEPRSSRRRESRGPQLALLVGSVIVVLGVVPFLVFRTPPGKIANELWEQAQVTIDESRATPAVARAKLAEAAELLETIQREYRKTDVAGTAAIRLTEVRNLQRAFQRIDAERKLAETGALDDEAILELRGRLGHLKRGGHPAVLREIADIEQELERKRTQRLREMYSKAERESRDHFVHERYASAAATWRDLEVPDYFMAKRVKTQLADVLRRVSGEYRARLRLAGRNTDIDARIGLLEACRTIFLATRHADDLEIRISALRAQKMRASVVTIQRKKKTTDSDKPEEPEEPVEAGPYEDPPKVAELIKARRYAEAASMLDSITRHPDAKVRIEELTLLAGLMADLVAAIDSRAKDFEKILLPNRVGRGNATGADRDFLKIEKDGKRTQYAWDSLPSKSFQKLFRQAGFHKPPRLATAIFFDEELLPRDAQNAYVAFFRSEQAPTTLTRILARRRAIEPPSEGFLLFRGQLITKAEKEQIQLGELIAKLGKKARSKSERIRRQTWVELEKLGEPALETLVAAVKWRRGVAVGEMRSSRAFMPSRFVAKFGRELQRRRKHALAFIMDAAQYPYPNKTPSAQKEAERRVDAVRDLYETPFNNLLEASEAAQLLSKEIKQLDAKLAELDPLSEPIHEPVVESITKSLNMRNVALDESDRKRISYNRAIEKYNRDLKDTTVDAEERGNVKAVNEYRWMMGRTSVKIDERLVRAARKHSIEMQQKKYFAHDSPTPSLRNPSIRARREGYGGGVAENIARGASTGRGAFKQWFGSSGHHRNMLIAGHTDLGCGAAVHHWWTQKFGRATGKSMSPPKVPPDPDPPGESGNGMPAPKN